MAYILFLLFVVFFFNDTATTEIYTLSLHDALPILNVTAPTCEEMLKRAEYAKELKMPIVMHDYLTAGFTANTTLARWCRDNGLLLHIHRAMHAVIDRSEEHTSELQSHSDLVCRLLLEKKKKNHTT